MGSKTAGVIAATGHVKPRHPLCALSIPNPLFNQKPRTAVRLPIYNF